MDYLTDIAEEAGVMVFGYFIFTFIFSILHTAERIS